MKLKVISISFLLAGVIFSFSSCYENTYVHGGRLYKAYCENCHMADGTGLKKIIPSLSNSDYLKDNQKLLPCLILNGINRDTIINGVSYTVEMTAYPHLSDVEITNIINYINHSWGNNIKDARLPDVKKALTECK